MAMVLLCLMVEAVWQSPYIFGSYEKADGDFSKIKVSDIISVSRV